MPKRVPHLDELERLEAIERLAAQWEEEDERAERERERTDRSWLSENSGGHMSETEKQWHPECQ